MAARHLEILQTIRETIVSGQYAPGAMLPQRVEFEQQFSATAPTIQRVFDRLREDGFIDIRHRVGTFVSARPPHLHRYALTFPFGPGDGLGWSRYYEALLQQARAVGDERGQEIVPYFSLLAPDGQAHARLQADVAAHRVAGIIHATNYAEIESNPAVPNVVIAAQMRHPAFGVIDLDFSALIDLGLRTLRAQGCRRIAVLEDFAGLSRIEPSAELRAQIRKHGLTLAKHGFLALPVGAADAARHWIELLLDRPAASRPQGILISDDNFIDAVAEGVVESGEGTGADRFRVVAHNNFPMPVARALPVYQIGYHAGQLLELALGYIDDCLAGAAPERVMAVKPKTQDDLAREEPDGPARRVGARLTAEGRHPSRQFTGVAEARV